MTVGELMGKLSDLPRDALIGVAMEVALANYRTPRQAGEATHDVSLCLTVGDESIAIATKDGS